MKIQAKEKNIRRIFHADLMDEPVEFVDGVAEVSRELGKKIVAIYNDIEELVEISDDEEE